MKPRTRWRSILIALVSVLVVLVVIFAIVVMSPQEQELTETKVLLDNGGFEGAWTRATTFWTPAGGPYHHEFNEIATPEGWVTWWREGFTCSGTSDWATGRPEVRVISGPDPERIRSGSQATQWFTFWRCHEGGLYQQVAVEAGKLYTLEAFGHSWFSNCDHRPYDGPYDYDCVTPITWAHTWLSAGIDPTGGIDPMASTVEWSIASEIYGEYGDQSLVINRIEAVSNTLTIFLRSEATHPLKHDDVYWDDVSLRDESYRVYLPIVGGADD